MRPIVSLITALVVAPTAFPTAVAAQDASRPLDTAARRAVVEKLGSMLEDHYVYPKVAEQTVADLKERVAAGEFEGVISAEDFAAQLTEVIQSTTHDKHIRVRVRPPARVEMEREDPAAAAAARAEGARRRNYSFNRIERLDGNIGYLELRGFSGSELAKSVAAAAMNFLANTDAVIIDLRSNGGGSPDMVRYLSSWFFGEPTHLNNLYFRDGDRTIEFWTLDSIPGIARPDVPLFVLTSSTTFSAAEEFSYNMLTQGRAMLIGEVTGGGANPGGRMPINEKLDIFIPGGAAVNPITGTNWEGVGVQPDVVISAGDALDKAIELAREAAEAFRQQRP